MQAFDEADGEVEDEKEEAEETATVTVDEKVKNLFPLKNFVEM